MAAFDPDSYLAQKTGQAFDPDTYLAQKTGDIQPPTQPGLGQRIGQGALKAAGWVNNFLNKFIAGPVQGATQAIQDKQPGQILPNMLKGFENPESVQSAQQAFARMGVNNNPQPASTNIPSGPDASFSPVGGGNMPSQADALGQAFGMAANPLNLLPAAGEIPVLGKLLSKAGDLGEGAANIASEFSGVKAPALIKAGTSSGRAELQAASQNAGSTGERLADAVNDLTKDMPEGPVANQAMAQMGPIDKTPSIAYLQSQKVEPLNGSLKTSDIAFNKKIDQAISDIKGKTEAQQEVTPQQITAPPADVDLNKDVNLFSAGDYLANGLKSGNNAIRINEKDLGAFGLLGPNGDRLPASVMRQKMGGKFVGVFPNSPRVQDIADKLNEEMGFGQTDAQGGLAASGGKIPYDLGHIDPTYGISPDDLIEAMGKTGSNGNQRALMMDEARKKYAFGPSQADLSQAADASSAHLPNNPPPVNPNQLLDPVWDAKNAHDYALNMTEGIDYNSPDASKFANAMKGARSIIRGQLQDAAQNSGNPEFKEAMQKMHDKYDLQEQMQQLIGGTEGVNQQSRATRLMGTINNPDKANFAKQKLLQAFDKANGSDFSGEAKTLNLANSLGPEGEATLMPTQFTGRSLMGMLAPKHLAIPFSSPVLASRATIPAADALSQLVNAGANTKPGFPVSMLMQLLSPQGKNQGQPQ